VNFTGMLPSVLGHALLSVGNAGKYDHDCGAYRGDL
jgi:hypothetical protein